jgi:glycosyltransferase involved in cell wall biosynthesis
MEILFAPDWRQGVPYQRLLAESLAEKGARVSFLSDYKRFLPLTRLMNQQQADLLHLHWPEAYYQRKNDHWDFLRRARFVSDLTLATRRTPFVFTAHNLTEHNYGGSFAHANYAAAYRRARLVFAHSTAAAAELVRTYGLPEEKIRVIPHGDLSATLPPPVPQAEARARLNLPAGKLCLMFGAVEPYKGQDEVISYWREAQPGATLVIAGRPLNPEYAGFLRRSIQSSPGVILRLEWLSDADLSLLLCAADVALFNYRAIFTSGAATLARSWGLPLLIPTRLSTVDLAEPDPRVVRFEGLDEDFEEKLDAALSMAPDYAAAANWRAQTAWERVAEATVTGYRDALEASPVKSLGNAASASVTASR